MPLNMQATSSLPPWVPVIIAAAWIAIGLFLSFAGGWRALSQIYRATEAIRGERLYLKSAAMRWGVAYRSCLNFGVDVHGLFVSIFPLFRIGCPPLFIPWSDIACTRQRTWLLDGVRLNFMKCPGVPIVLSAGVAKQVFAHAPVQLPTA